MFYSASQKISNIIHRSTNPFPKFHISQRRGRSNHIHLVLRGLILVIAPIVVQFINQLVLLHIDMPAVPACAAGRGVGRQHRAAPSGELVDHGGT